MKLFTKVTLGLCLFLFSLLSLAYGQANMRIQGKVLDAATHEGIAGATVSVIGAEAKASTDAQDNSSWPMCRQTLDCGYPTWDTTVQRSSPKLVR